MNATWRGYAAARVQARFGRRPEPHDFRRLESSRTVGHLRESLREGSLAQFVPALGANPSPDEFEARLRAAWRATCAEVSHWHAPEWALAFQLIDVHADLPALELLRAAGPVPAWLQKDDRLNSIARAPDADRMSRVAAIYGAAFAAACASTAPLIRHWTQAWHASWPSPGRQVAAILTEVAQLLIVPWGGDGPSLDSRLRRLERLQRRAHGTPAAAFTYLTLVSTTLQRIRGAHAALLAGGTR